MKKPTNLASENLFAQVPKTPVAPAEGSASSSSSSSSNSGIATVGTSTLAAIGAAFVAGFISQLYTSFAVVHPESGIGIKVEKRPGCGPEVSVGRILG